jgi:hypothetical protein
MLFLPKPVVRLVVLLSYYGLANPTKDLKLSSNFTTPNLITELESIIKG